MQHHNHAFVSDFFCSKLGFSADSKKKSDKLSLKIKNTKKKFWYGLNTKLP